MRIRKSDIAIIRESEKEGLMVSMNRIVGQERTKLNDELNDYFRGKMPSYQGSWDEYDSKDILCSINKYLKEKNINKRPLNFPLSGGSDLHLIPINKNIQLKVLVVDEYYGDGDYDKYVMANSFRINKETSQKDVDVLIDFVETVLS